MLDNITTKTIKSIRRPELEIGPLKVSLFQLLKQEFGEELPVARLTKAALVQMSHALEGVVINHGLPAVVFTGFQQSSYWLKEVKRYRDMAGLAEAICIFSGPPSPTLAENAKTAQQVTQAAEAVDTVHVTLADDDALRQEWFLIVLTSEFSVLLCGLDQLEPVDREADRVFDTFISFDPAVVGPSLNLLEGVLAHYRQDKLAQVQQARRHFPPVMPTPRYLSLLTTQFVEQAGYYRKIARQLDQEQAMRATINRLLHDSSQPVTALLALLELSKQSGEVLPEDLDTLLEASYDLKQILSQLRNTTQFSNKKFHDIDYLDTGEPIF